MRTIVNFEARKWRKRMAEPKTRAEKIERLLPWLLHWSIVDDRIGGFRSDSFAVKTSDGLMVIGPLPLEEKQQASGQPGAASTQVRLRGSMEELLQAPQSSQAVDQDGLVRHLMSSPQAW